MEALLLGLLITAVFSIPLSYVIEIKNALRLFKDAANLGYKFNAKKFSEMPTDKEGTKKLFSETLLIPFYNLFIAYAHIEQYNNTINLQLEQYAALGVLEEMSSYEKKYYEEKPKVLTAIDISVGLTDTLAMKGQTTGSIVDKETNSEIKFAIGKHAKDIKILDATGIYENMPLEEQQKVVAKDIIAMYDEVTEEYGSFDKFMKEVEADPSKAKLNKNKNDDIEKRDYVSEKTRLEELKQEALRLEELDKQDEKTEQPKVKKK